MSLRHDEPANSLDCVNCARKGEVSFEDLERAPKEPKLKITNLPDRITEEGVKHLFIRVGKPVSISFFRRTSTAIVLLNSMREAHMAIMQLNGTPPYFLNVALTSEPFSLEGEEALLPPENRQGANFSARITRFRRKKYQDSDEAEGKKKEGFDDAESKARSLIAEVGYNPWVRTRQKMLDFKTNAESVSMGRGYIAMGSTDVFVGGMEKVTFSSEGSKAKDMMNFYCANCKAHTTKMCGSCSVSFCSLHCAKKDLRKHDSDCPAREDEELPEESEEEEEEEQATVKHPFPTVSLKSKSSVLMTFYSTMRKVFVRLQDKPWEEKYSLLLNDVAEEAFKGRKLERNPVLHELVIAKYSEDQLFYRAQVREILDSEVNVQFIDFGNSQKTKLEDLRFLPKHLAVLPALAVEVELEGVSEFSSPGSVRYLNHLTADCVPLVLKFAGKTNEVLLTEKDTGKKVNESLYQLSLPSWKKDDSVLLKSSEIMYLEIMSEMTLAADQTYDLFLCHFTERQFSESTMFWMQNQNTDYYLQFKMELSHRIKEYVEFLKEDFYLPRPNEVCLAMDDRGEWHRCVSLKSHDKNCCLFFLDIGCISIVETANIRKMLEDFTEAPSQAICVKLAGGEKLKENKKLLDAVVNFFKGAVGQTIKSVRVKDTSGSAFAVSIPEVDAIMKEGN